jgi:hydroxyacylglutathione hydrolase
MHLVASIETHVHADFVSGGRELAATGASLITGPGADLKFDAREVHDGESIQLGDVRLTFLHTPGHTFEHITIASDAPGEPPRLFTGDLLFVGGVGRPDLVGAEQTRLLAGQLFESLQRLLRMDGAIEVHPGHGAGSLCGAGIGKEPSTTIAREREQNPMLRYTDRDAFIAAVIADIPETPPYFARMKTINQQGPDVLGLAAGTRRVPSISPAAAAALAADGAVIVDLRPGTAFAAGHPDGAVNLAHGTKVGYWGGWVVPPDAPMLLLADDSLQAQDAAVQLLRVGLDRVEGAIAGGYEGWTAAALPTAAIEVIPADQLRSALARRPLQLIDVRTSHEFHAGHIPGSINIPVGEIPKRLGELPDGPLATICEGGYRSSLAASLLAQEGRQDVANVAGGMSAYRAAEELRT